MTEPEGLRALIQAAKKLGGKDVSEELLKKMFTTSEENVYAETDIEHKKTLKQVITEQVGEQLLDNEKETD